MGLTRKTRLPPLNVLRFALVHLYRLGALRRAAWVGMERGRVLAAVNRALAALYEEQTAIMSQHSYSVTCCVGAPGCFSYLADGRVPSPGVCFACLYVDPRESLLAGLLLTRVSRRKRRPVSL